MARHTLASYIIRVVNEQGEYKQVDNFGNGSDLFNVFKEYLNYRANRPSIDKDSKKIAYISDLWIEDDQIIEDREEVSNQLEDREEVSNQSEIEETKEKKDGRMLRGIIGSGEYGYGSVILDAANNCAKSYEKSITEADSFPYYFLIKIPKNTNEGVLMLERFKTLGIKTTFFNDFREYFRRTYPNFDIKINYATTAGIIKHWMFNGRVTKVKFIQFTVPKNMEEIYDVQNHGEVLGYVETNMIATRNSDLSDIPVLNRLFRMVNPNFKIEDAKNMIEISDMSYDNLKFESTMGKNRRTFDLSHLDKVLPYYDISSEVTIDNNGHPSFESIDTIAKEYLKDISKTMGWGSINDD